MALRGWGLQTLCGRLLPGQWWWPGVGGLVMLYSGWFVLPVALWLLPEERRLPGLR